MFRGTFDGDNHTVSGVYINSEADYQGLFGYAYDATIKNVGVVESYIKGRYHVGGVVGQANGKVINCYNTGAVTCSGTGSYVGGVVGYVYESNCTVSNCYYLSTAVPEGKTGIGGTAYGKNPTITSIGSFDDDGNLTADTDRTLEYGDTLAVPLNNWVYENKDANPDLKYWVSGNDQNGFYPIFTDDTWDYENNTEFTINNKDELEYFSSLVNRGYDFNDKIVKLGADINFSDSGAWTPIGGEGHPFKGTFNGQRNTISGISISGNTDYQGLFGYVDGAKIQNLTVKGSVTGRNEVGGVVGCAINSEISDCTNNAIVTAESCYKGKRLCRRNRRKCGKGGEKQYNN